MFEISPITLISFVSTVTAYYVAYFLPVVMIIVTGNYVIEKVKAVQKVSDNKKKVNLDCFSEYSNDF